MIYGSKEWVVKGKVRDDLLPEFNFTPVFKSLITQRGLNSAREINDFLNPNLGLLKDPSGMKGIEVACERIADAIQAGERIAIFSDYDVDGVCSAALMHRFLVRLGQAAPLIFIPDRHVDGYGLNRRGLDELKRGGASLLITADCGITDIGQVAYARSLGLDVIVTDHHEPEAELPDALAVINPKQAECPFGQEDLCGAGVIFHLIIALRSVLRERGVTELPNLRQDLDLVALATVADVVALKGVNRILVKEGLGVLNSYNSPGTSALARVAGIRSEIMARDLGFILGPRINAAGRMGSAGKALDLLISDESWKSATLANELHQLNRQRQAQEQKVLKEAIAMVEEQPESDVIMVAGEGWNMGVIGIVASRLVSRFKKPAIVIAVGAAGECKGSGRSIEGVDLHGLLGGVSDLLVRYGGHKMAIGLTIERDNLPKLQQALANIMDGVEPEGRSRVEVDLAISPLDLSPELLDELEALGPFGEGNPEPVFMIRRMELTGHRKLGNSRVKFILTHSNRTFHSQGCSMPVSEDELPRYVDVAFTPVKIRSKGHVYLSLALKALSPA